MTKEKFSELMKLKHGIKETVKPVQADTQTADRADIYSKFGKESVNDCINYMISEYNSGENGFSLIEMSDQFFTGKDKRGLWSSLVRLANFKWREQKLELVNGKDGFMYVRPIDQAEESMTIDELESSIAKEDQSEVSEPMTPEPPTYIGEVSEESSILRDTGIETLLTNQLRAAEKNPNKINGLKYYLSKIGLELVINLEVREIVNEEY